MLTGRCTRFRPRAKFCSRADLRSSSRAESIARFGLALLALLLALACGSCTTTPTLPLPPPLASVGLPDSDGFAAIEGQVQALAFVSVLNEASEEGVITRADGEGQFKTRIAAKSGDLLTLWQDLGDGDRSLQKQVTVPGPR